MTTYSHFFCRILLAVIITGCHALSSAAGNALVVGQVIDLSGPNGALGRDYVAGIRTYFDAINAAGGVNGKRIQYVVRDDAGDSANVAQLATGLIEHDQVTMLIGGIGDDNEKAMLDTPAFKRTTLSLFAPLASAKNPRVINWRPSYQQELRFLLDYFEKLGVKRVGIAHQNGAIHNAALNALSQELQKKGMTISASVSVDGSTSVTAAEAKKLADSKPGFVMLIADTVGSGVFLKEFRRNDARTFVAGTSLTNLATLREIAGMKAVEWTVFSQVVPNPSGATTPLQIEHSTMMKKYRDEAVSSLTLEGFLVAKTLTKTLSGQKRDIDLGGMFISAGNSAQPLSQYLDIALFKKGAGLVF